MSDQDVLGDITPYTHNYDLLNSPGRTRDRHVIEVEEDEEAPRFEIIMTAANQQQSVTDSECRKFGLS